jgi:hypothetical membrane protein
MHTLIMVVSGLVALAVFLAAARLLGMRPAGAARLFIPLWLVASIINLGIGVFRAGVPLTTELAVLVAVFGLPALAAWLAASRLGA